jgi:hypothetical protein
LGRNPRRIDKSLMLREKKFRSWIATIRRRVTAVKIADSRRALDIAGEVTARRRRVAVQVGAIAGSGYPA